MFAHQVIWFYVGCLWQTMLKLLLEVMEISHILVLPNKFEPCLLVLELG